MRLAVVSCALAAALMGCENSAPQSGEPVNDAAAAANLPGGSNAGKALPPPTAGTNDAAAAANVPK
ncbi:MAG: hypothetical protein K0Q72_947 [Armatimonadetes bacterium]|jgi:hypothetical protein|nr:hypothetical protein [Armatimonadota bacterium]